MKSPYKTSLKPKALQNDVSEIKQCQLGNQAAPTRKSSSANSEIKQCLMRHSDWLRFAQLDVRVTYNIIYTNLIGHSVIKQCKTRKSTFYRESVP